MFAGPVFLCTVIFMDLTVIFVSVLTISLIGSHTYKAGTVKTVGHNVFLSSVFVFGRIFDVVCFRCVVDYRYINRKRPHHRCDLLFSG